jgi:hypothetical protein
VTANGDDYTSGIHGAWKMVDYNGRMFIEVDWCKKCENVGDQRAVTL